jgi:hypothetical protein
VVCVDIHCEALNKTMRVHAFSRVVKRFVGGGRSGQHDRVCKRKGEPVLLESDSLQTLVRF